MRGPPESGRRIPARDRDPRRERDGHARQRADLEPRRHACAAPRLDPPDPQDRPGRQRHRRYRRSARAGQRPVPRRGPDGVAVQERLAHRRGEDRRQDGDRRRASEDRRPGGPGSGTDSRPVRHGERHRSRGRTTRMGRSATAMLSSDVGPGPAIRPIAIPRSMPADRCGGKQRRDPRRRGDGKGRCPSAVTGRCALRPVTTLPRLPRCD